MLNNGGSVICFPFRIIIPSMEKLFQLLFCSRIETFFALNYAFYLMLPNKIDGFYPVSLDK